MSKGRLVGIDFGAARIGVAVSDEMKMIASPWKVVPSDKKLKVAAQNTVQALKEIESEKGSTIEQVIVGMPLKMNGQIGLQADDVKEYVEELKALTTIPVKLWDERLTTVQAERMLREASMSRKKRSKVVDTVAATIILQSYLDFAGGL